MTSDLLLALATERSLSHAVACRLACSIEAWSDEPESAISRLAADLTIAPRHLRKALALRRDAPSRAKDCRDRARHEGVSLVTWGESRYPIAFRQLELPPAALWVRGDPEILAHLDRGPAVAIVGSRRASRHGLEVAELFARRLAEAGVGVVSGFARGIDAAAHRGALAVAEPLSSRNLATPEPASARGGGHNAVEDTALATNCGKTVAVLGCGVGIDYPRGHRPLAAEISRRGALISEFGISRPPRAWCFPVRNRLIAALAELTLVVEATVKSGSLITARLALELGREVWAVPGRIFDSGAGGTNALIRDGAHPALSPSELLEGLHLEPSGSDWTAQAPALEESADLSEDARRLITDLTPSASCTADELTRSTELALDTVLNALLELELLGIVERLPGGGYRRRLATSDRGVLRCPPEAASSAIPPE